MVYGSRLDGKAISRWPCAAYASENPADGCTGEGKSRCSKCRLVSYCSPTCQSSHWKTHKKQCNSSYLKNSWTTQWQREARLPSFVRLTDGSGPKYDYVGNTSHYVWGNVFAYDCLNTAHNEGEAARSQDFTICFAASGDLRNAMMTVNSLPEDYSGKCRILLNDRDTVVAGRNAFLLHVLQHADQMDIDELAELCTHVMYSAALTEPQHDAVLTGLESIFRHAPGDGMPIVGTQGRMHINIFLHKILDMSRSTFDWPTARQKRHDVVLNPSRVDFLHRAIWPLRPAHRAAEMHYFQTGIVLPFGAPTDHFTYPNRLLFDANAEWLPPDETRLLSGWDPRAVIASGAQHGCPAEDIYGCIFFHVRAQFAELARRIQRMHVEFGVTNYDATLLSSMLAKGYRPLPSAPSPHRFDRVETSNIMDFVTNAERIVETWAPLLNRANPHAALLMHTINWGESTPDASPTSEAATTRLYPRAFEYSGFTKSPNSDFLHPLHFTAMLWLDSFYDHEAAYEEYIRRIRVRHFAARAGLKLKDRNSITPKRLGFSLEGSPDNVPHFSKEEWYLLVILAKRPTIHRYLELVVA